MKIGVFLTAGLLCLAGCVETVSAPEGERAMAEEEMTEQDSGTGMDGDALTVSGLEVRADKPASELARPGDKVTIDGMISWGAECKIMTLKDGTVFSLTHGGLPYSRFEAGKYARITGTVQRTSTCQQGLALSVEEISYPETE